MPTPPLLFLEPRDAVQRVCNAFACTDDEAVAFLRDAWFAGTISPRFVGPPPPAGYDPTKADWFSGEIVIRTRQQTSTIPIGGYKPFERFDREQRGFPPREYSFPMRTLTKHYPFKIDRRQLDAILEEGAAAATRPDPPVLDSDEREPQSAPGAAGRYKPELPRKPDPRNKGEAMIDGLETALAAGALATGKRATLKAAHQAMLQAMGYKEEPTGMGIDAFSKHCKSWLKERGIYR